MNIMHGWWKRIEQDYDVQLAIGNFLIKASVVLLLLFLKWFRFRTIRSNSSFMLVLPLLMLGSLSSNLVWTIIRRINYFASSVLPSTFFCFDIIGNHLHTYAEYSRYGNRTQLATLAEQRAIYRFQASRRRVALYVWVVGNGLKFWRRIFVSRTTAMYLSASIRNMANVRNRNVTSWYEIPSNQSSHKSSYDCLETPRR